MAGQRGLKTKWDPLDRAFFWLSLLVPLPYWFVVKGVPRLLAAPLRMETLLWVAPLMLASAAFVAAIARSIVGELPSALRIGWFLVALLAVLSWPVACGTATLKTYSLPRDAQVIPK